MIDTQTLLQGVSSTPTTRLENAPPYSSTHPPATKRKTMSAGRPHTDFQILVEYGRTQTYLRTHDKNKHPGAQKGPTNHSLVTFKKSPTKQNKNLLLLVDPAISHAYFPGSCRTRSLSSTPLRRKYMASLRETFVHGAPAGMIRPDQQTDRPADTDTTGTRQTGCVRKKIVSTICQPNGS